MTVSISRIRPDDGPMLRDLRIRALTDAPEAFGATLDETLARPDDEWSKRAATGADADQLAYWFAHDGPDVIGIVGVFHDVAVDLPHLISMWVDPSFRGCGVARRLVETVVEFAIAGGAPALILDVAPGNGPARTLYERSGFVAVGTSDALPSDPATAAIRMRLDLPPVRPITRPS